MRPTNHVNLWRDMDAAIKMVAMMNFFLCLMAHKRKKVAMISLPNHHQRALYWITEKNNNPNPRYEAIVYLLLFFPIKRSHSAMPRYIIA